jgi:hypothetical protein
MDSNNQENGQDINEKFKTEETGDQGTQPNAEAEAKAKALALTLEHIAWLKANHADDPSVVFLTMAGEPAYSALESIYSKYMDIEKFQEPVRLKAVFTDFQKPETWVEAIDKVCKSHNVNREKLIGGFVNINFTSEGLKLSAGEKLVVTTEKATGGGQAGSTGARAGHTPGFKAFYTVEGDKNADGTECVYKGVNAAFIAKFPVKVQGHTFTRRDSTDSEQAELIKTEFPNAKYSLEDGEKADSVSGDKRYLGYIFKSEEKGSLTVDGVVKPHIHLTKVDRPVKADGTKL